MTRPAATPCQAQASATMPLRGWGSACLVALLLGLALGAARADEAGMVRRFEAARRDEPSLIAFLNRMPKGGDLHVHLSGSVYAETLLDHAVQRGLYFDPATRRFEAQEAPGCVAAARLLDGQASPLLAQFLEAASMRGSESGSLGGHDHFFRAFSTVGSVLRFIPVDDWFGDIVARAHAQNVQYLEVMGSEVVGNAYGPLLADPPSASDPATALAALQPKLEAFVRSARAQLDIRDRAVAARAGVRAPVTGVSGPITVRYLMTASRLLPLDSFLAAIAGGMALARADRRVVGVNILAPEDHPLARTQFEAQMHVLDALWRHFGRPNVTLHAGELTLRVSPVEAMRSRIRRSIEAGHARRIGHGVSIAWEEDLRNLLRRMRDSGTAVEICLSSNDGILGVKGNRHPFQLYRHAGVPLALCTDDEGVSRSNLTMEYVRAVRSYGLSYSDVKTLARNGVEYSFLPGISLYPGHDYRRLRGPFTGVRQRHWSPSAAAQRLMEASEKLAVQVRLERALVRFENAE